MNSTSLSLSLLILSSASLSLLSDSPFEFFSSIILSSALWFVIFSIFLLKFSFCSCVIPWCQLISMIIILKFLSDKSLISISLILFQKFCLVLLLETYSSVCLPLISPFWFYALDKTSTSSKVKEVVLCRNEGVILCKRSVQFICSVVSDSATPWTSQHTRLPCPSPTPGACSNSCLSSRWCHPTISSSVVPFSSCLQSFPASGSFPMNQFFASDGQTIGISVSSSVLPM